MSATCHRTIADRFELLEEVASGGMGTVYKALDRVGGDHVAVKLLPPGGSVERFGRETAMLAAVRHPGVVRYVAHGSDGPEGREYVVTEWLEGETLEARLRRERLPLRDSLTLAIEVAEVLGAVHARGIVHRDVKPSNVFLVGGRLAGLKLLDFGLARRDLDTRVTREGTWVGTPVYMSPEQARGDRLVTAAADVFSLGCMLFECIAGAPPVSGERARAILARIILDDAPRLRLVSPASPQAVDDLIARMLDRRAEARPADGVAAAAALRALRDHLLPEELEAVAPPGVSAASLSMDDEVRVVSVVLVAPADVSHLDLAKLVDGYGAELEPLADGSMVARPRRPDTPRDQATQMARCALALRERAPRAEIAVATGPALVSGGATLGDVLDRGCELLAAGSAGGVAVDETTAALVEPRFAVEHTGGRRLVRRELDGDERPRRVAGVGTRFVGRARELDLLGAAWAECRDEGTAQCVLCTAPPGMGKSRLWQELAARLREGGAAPEILIARGDPLRASSPFGMLISVLGGADADPGALRARLGRHLTGAVRERVCTFLGELAGVRVGAEDDPALHAARCDAKLMAAQVRGAWLDWLEAETAAAPVLFIADDAHWADAPTMEYLAAALAALRRRPFMLAVFARPEVHDRFPELWRRVAATEVRLGELAPRASEALLEQILGGDVPSAVRDGIVARAQGNPFFLEELVRSARAGADPAASAPDSVVGLMHARLDALGGMGKRVLRAASIFGERFPVDGVRALLGDDDAGGVADALAQLESMELVYETRGGGEHAFGHGLLRDASYALLTETDRRLGHRLAGQWLEQRGQANPMLLIEHYERAGELSHVARWSARAALRQIEAGDLRSAIGVADRGIAAGAEGELHGELLLLQAQAHRWRDDATQAERCARAALTRLKRRGALWFKAVGELGSAQFNLHGRLDDLSEHLDEILRAAAPEAEEERLYCLGLLCGEAVLSGQMDLATALRPALGDAEALARSYPRAAAPLLHANAVLDVYRCRLQSGAEKVERAMTLCDQIGDLVTGASMRANLASILEATGRFAEAEVLLEQARATGERMAADAIVAIALLNRVWLLVQQDRYPEAVEQARLVLERSPNPRIRGQAHLYLAVAALRARDAAAAEREARAALAFVADMPPVRPFVEAVLALGLLERGARDEACALAASAARQLESAPVEEGEAFIRMAEVETLEACGDRAGAAAALARACRRLDEQAADLTADGLRASFLDGVPENRALRERARAWGMTK